MKANALPSSAWRIHAEMVYDVYEGDRLVFQCPSVADASRIVAAMNAAAAVDIVPNVDPVPDWDVGPTPKPSSRALRKERREPQG